MVTIYNNTYNKKIKNLFIKSIIKKKKENKN